jgi:hypothetical protein
MAEALRGVSRVAPASATVTMSRPTDPHDRAPVDGRAATSGSATTLSAPSSAVLDAVEAPVTAAELTLTSGRRYEITTDHDRDRVVIRSRSGEIVLRVEVTDAGPVLSFSGAVVELAASRRLHLAAEEVAVEAKRDLSVHVGGSMHERVEGDHHLRVRGEERVEAAKVEVQANERGVAVRAMEEIALDGAHIGLNDDPAPEPFPWSAIAGGPDEA